MAEHYLRNNMEVKVELYGKFLGYVPHPKDIAALAIEKGVDIEEALDIKISYVQSPGVHVLTKVRNSLIAEKAKKAAFDNAVKEASEKAAPKKRGRKPKLEEKTEAAE